MDTERQHRVIEHGTACLPRCLVTVLAPHCITANLPGVNLESNDERSMRTQTNARLGDAEGSPFGGLKKKRAEKRESLLIRAERKPIDNPPPRTLHVGSIKSAVVQLKKKGSLVGL